MAVHNLGTVISSKQEKVALTKPNTLEALFTAFDMWRCNFNSLSLVAPRSGHQRDTVHLVLQFGVVGT